jgi:hypothetical protein
VSTAYQFFEAVMKFLIFNAQDYSKRAKLPFEATGYELFYVASDEIDEQGKTHVTLTLDMSTKWDCTPLPGCKTSYEFIGLQPTVDGRKQIGMRILPCPCEFCLSLTFESCLNRDIVGNMGFTEMRAIEHVESPAELNEPIATNCNVLQLKAFVLHHDMVLPKGVTRKAEIVTFIQANLSQFLNDEIP